MKVEVEKGKTVRAKVRTGYSFIRAKGNMHIEAGTLIEDLTMEEAQGQLWKLDFLKDAKASLEVDKEVEEEIVEEKEEKEVGDTKKEGIEEEKEGTETKDIEAPPADRAVKRKKRK